MPDCTECLAPLGVAEIMEDENYNIYCLPCYDLMFGFYTPKQHVTPSRGSWGIDEVLGDI